MALLTPSVEQLGHLEEKQKEWEDKISQVCHLRKVQCIVSITFQ